MSVELVVRHGRHEARLARPDGRWRAFWRGPWGTVAFVAFLVAVWVGGMAITWAWVMA